VRKFALAPARIDTRVRNGSHPGLIAGQRLIPVNVAGCYVPTGRYAHIASAYMSVATAKAAGVPTVIACSTPYRGDGRNDGIHSEVLYAMHVAGRRRDHDAGQACRPSRRWRRDSSPAGPPTSSSGPGNKFVAEAKRMLFGPGRHRRVRRAVGNRGHCRRFAPIREWSRAISSARPSTGTSRPRGSSRRRVRSARAVLRHVPRSSPRCRRRPAMPPAPRGATTAKSCVRHARRSGATSDQYASEHLEVHARDLDWWLANLTCYGSLFLGEETTVAYGDKASGPNHILPTKGAARDTPAGCPSISSSRPSRGSA
jgi:sulfopropanediol 3-dehydrogenase